MKIHNSLIFFLLFTLSPLLSFGEDFLVSFENSKISALRPGQQVTAGFFNITTSEDAKIIKIKANMIGSIEAHSMIIDGEIMKMRKITPQLIKNKKYKFRPGGNHLMLFNVKRELRAGDDIDLLFTFQLKNKEVLSKSIPFKVK
jgi:copper(I)-binding protein